MRNARATRAQRGEPRNSGGKDDPMRRFLITFVFAALPLTLLLGQAAA